MMSNNDYHVSECGDSVVQTVVTDLIGSGGSGFESRLAFSFALHFPLASLFLEFFSMGVGTRCVIDQSKLQQGTENECQANARPNVNGLKRGFSIDQKWIISVGPSTARLVALIYRRDYPII